MKKTFRTILAGALALLAVSCYDDSDLRGQLGDLDERLDKVEATLNAETGGIADLLGRIETLEGKIAAIKVETDAETGLTTLTLSDGSSVALSKNGVLTIVDGGWATVAANGTVTPLNIKVDHPKLAFKVEGGELKVSYDGTTYEATGVEVSEYTAHVIGDVVVAEDGKSVTVKIGDKTLKLPLAVQSGEITFSRDSFYVGYGLSKKVTVEGIEDFYVAAKPNGWVVTTEGNVLTVTAPSKNAADLGIIENEGVVVVHGDDEGCVYASMTVTTGPAFSVDVNKENGDVTFFNAIAVEYTDRETGDVMFDFADAYVGILTVSDFEHFSTPDELVTAHNNELVPGAGLANIKINKELGAAYKEGEYEEDQFTMTLSDLGHAFWPKVRIQEGESYVVWAIPQNADGAMTDLYTYAVYKPAKTIIEAADITYCDAKFHADLSGAQKYILGCVEDPEPKYGITLEQYMSESYPWNYMTYGMADEVNTYYVEGKYEGEDAYSMSELVDGPLKPNTKYYYFAIPHNAGTVYNDYANQFDPYVKSFTTAAVTAGEVAEPTIAEKLGYKNVSATITPAEGTTVYYAYVTSEDNLAFENDEARLAYLMGNCYSPFVEEGTTTEYMSPGQNIILLYAAISSEGEYKVWNKSQTALVYPAEVNDALTVGISEVTATFTTLSVNLTPSENTKVYWRWYSNSTLDYYNTDAKLLENVLSGKLAEGVTEAKDENLAAGSDRTLVVAVIDADNKYKLFRNTYTTTALTYDETMTVNMVSVVVDEDAMTATVKVKVEGTQKAALYLGYSGFVKSFELNVFTREPESGVVFVDVDAEGYAQAVLSEYWGDYMVVYATGLKEDELGNVAAISTTAGQFTVKDYLSAETE